MSIIKGNVICCDDCGLIAARLPEGPPQGWVEVRVWLRLRHLCPECKNKRIKKWRYPDAL